jgi:methionyl-tRNA synthetase
MPDSPSKFFLTTPIYYVNARPHIGHAYTTIVADVLARRSRAQNPGVDSDGLPNTWFLTGTDEHGQKIERSAQAAGIPPQQFTDQVSAEFKQLWDRMGLTYNQYIRTTDPAHKRGVQHLWRELASRGHIYLSSYTGQYCVSEEIFVEGPPGTIGPDGRPTETVTEENYFFRLSAFQLDLINLLESDTLEVRPESRKNELLSFLRGNVSAASGAANSPGAPSFAESHLAKGGVSSEARPPSSEAETTGPSDIPRNSTQEPTPEDSAPTTPTLAYSAQGNPYVPGALRDLSVSRSSFTWGIPVPDDPKHVIYVWLDALANYMTAVGYGDDSPEAQAKFAKYWPADLHLVGKEIIRQHCIYWPAFLLAADLPLPKKVVAHGWLLFEESKMSKSRGNIVRTETILQAFGTLAPPPLPSAGTAPLLVIPSEAEEPASVLASLSTQPVILSELTRPAGDESKDPEAASPATPAHNHPPTASLRAGAPSSRGLIAQAGVSSEARPPSSELASTSPHHRDLFAADVLRYFLLREIPFGQDGSFSFDAMITRYNADLANGYGNLVSRVLTLIITLEASGRELRIPSQLTKVSTLNKDLESFAKIIVDVMTDEFKKCRFTAVITAIQALVGQTDTLLTDTKPWKLIKSEVENDLLKACEILYTAAESIRILTALLYPILPYATAAVWRQLGLGEIEAAAQRGDLTNLTWGGLQPGTKLDPLAPIFPRADKGLAQIMADIESSNAPKPPEFKEAPIASASGDAPLAAEESTYDPAAGPRTGSFSEPSPGAQVAGSTAITTERPGTPHHTEAQASGIFTAAAPAGPTDASPQITIDDFAKVELRVAKVLVAERIPKADKLLRLEVDLGYETRQILSGIAEWYTPEDLLGRRIVVITNLAPRKMRGLESHGMLLAASAPEGGKPALATFLDTDDLPLGARLR